ncbi:DUF1990 family protein [Paeniglutamicibacter sp. ORCA_105]|uniref:DUF1990 family protein n=1 Tax=Paeniglutamicibacter sp. ORCA_105 TaxID=3377336 RepID=UPI0038930668
MFEPLRRKLQQTFSAQEHYDPVWERELDRGDDAGYFPHDSAVWVVHGGMSPIAAGIRALLTQALHPGALAGVAEHSKYQSDPLARLAGTIRWIFTLTYGDTAAADEACAWVARRHEAVTGSYIAGTGEEREYAANDPDLAGWVHLAFADAFLRSHEIFSGPVPQGADAYVREWAKAGELMGVPNPPRSDAELREAIAGYEARGELAGGPRVAEVVSFLKNPPLDPAVLPGYKVLFAAVVATLPENHRKMLGLWRPTAGMLPVPARLGGKVALGLAGLALAKQGPAELAARRRLFRLGVLCDLSYPEPGFTDSVPVPAGYRTLQVRERVGEGEAAFEALAEGIMGWKLHEAAGLRVRADTPTVQLASRVRLGIGVGPARIEAPCRVVRLIESGTRRGFAYGTLAGHPETGEESFTAVLEPDGSVHLELKSVSRPSEGFHCLATPVTEAAQALVTGRYVVAARRLAAG